MTIKKPWLKFKVWFLIQTAVSILFISCSFEPTQEMKARKYLLSVKTHKDIGLLPQKNYMESWVKAFKEYTCPAWDSQLMEIKNGEGQIIASVDSPKGKQEVVGTKPIKIACFYSFQVEVPYAEEYQIAGVGKLSHWDLENKKWKASSDLPQSLSSQTLGEPW